MPVFRRFLRLGGCAGLLLALMAGAALAAPKPAATLPAPAIAIIDVQKILQDSLAAKSVQKQLEAQRAVFQSETDKEENELRQTEQDLAKTRNHLTPSAYAVRQQQLSQRLLGVENHVENRRRVLDQAFTHSMDTVRDSLLAIVEAVARAHGANIVLVKQQALWMEPGFDITDEVLRQLDRKLPDVMVKMAPESPAPEKPK